ncbi:hypothetical protein ACJX0J_015773, partial [Zea mays]
VPTIVGTGVHRYMNILMGISFLTFGYKQGLPCFSLESFLIVPIYPLHTLCHGCTQCMGMHLYAAITKISQIMEN